MAPGSFATALLAGALLGLVDERTLGVGVAETVVPGSVLAWGKTSAELGGALAGGSSRRVV